MADGAVGLIGENPRGFHLVVVCRFVAQEARAQGHAGGISSVPSTLAGYQLSSPLSRHDVADDLGHGAVVLLLDRLVDLDAGVQRPGERHVLDDRYVAGDSKFADFRAMRSMPLATQTGACMPASYFSATAKCVGLVTTTVALGTFAIIRLRERSRRSCLILPLISGLPSDLLELSPELLRRHLLAGVPALVLVDVVGQRDDRHDRHPPRSARS